MDDLHATLKKATTPLHRELDARVAEFGPFSSASAYACYLQVMSGLYSGYADLLDRASTSAGLPPVSQEARRYLTGDLDLLNDEVGCGNLTAESAKQNDPDARSLGWALGVGYTMEGSSLGAKYLVRSFDSSFETGAPNAYLSFLAGAASTRWPIYIQHLQSVECSERDAVEGAKAVFTSAIEVFEGLVRDAREQKG